MSWTIQSRWVGDVKEVAAHLEWTKWDDWSGAGAYRELDQAVEVFARLIPAMANRDRWIWRIFDKETEEVIPLEAFGV